jgi:hypothetical protein
MKIVFFVPPVNSPSSIQQAEAGEEVTVKVVEGETETQLGGYQKKDTESCDHYAHANVQDSAH